MALPLVGTVLDIGKTLIERLIPDKKAQAEALQKLEEMHQAGDLQVISGQIEINKIEAASTNVFIAGWRPFVGWTLGAGLAVMLVIGPLMAWGSALAGKPMQQPEMPTEIVLALTTSLLGMSGMRSWEKYKGVQGKR